MSRWPLEIQKNGRVIMGHHPSFYPKNELQSDETAMKLVVAVIVAAAADIVVVVAVVVVVVVSVVCACVLCVLCLL